MVTVPVAGALAETVSGEGEKVQVAWMGRPEQARVTLPLKPLVGATLMVAWADLPAVTVAAPVEALKPKVAVPEDVELLEIPPSRPWA